MGKPNEFCIKFDIEGWVKFDMARKRHFFDESGMSLCRKWGTQGKWREDYDGVVRPDECKVCRMKLEKRQELAAKESSDE